MKRFLSLVMTASMVAMLFAGCSKTESNTAPASEPATATVENAVDVKTEKADKAEIPSRPYFTKGVYLNMEEGSQSTGKMIMILRE